MATVEALAALLHGKRVAVLTGAGCSTESGIPDYRGEGTRRRARAPMQWRDFAASADARRRYWARAMLGWERFSRAAPNAAHHALAALERRGVVTGVVTQNVDRLHHAAHSIHVIELHGALAETRCTECGAHEERTSVQSRLAALNPGFGARAAELLPDGDARLPDDVVAIFTAPACLACNGALRPNVVFFGEAVPRPVVDAAFALVDAADALLVVGTSLAVFSGFRFVRHAAARSTPIAIVNVGPCRGEELAAVQIDGRVGEVLPALAALLATTA